VENLAGKVVSSTSLWKVRTGKTKNPSQRLLQALSQAFQVPVSFFFDENVSPESIKSYQAQFQSEKMVEQIALRSAELDDEGKQAILDMINVVRKAQKADQP
jgi:transcriptional regulator with XRE-family HTH domain